MFSWGEHWKGPFELVEQEHPILIEDSTSTKSYCIEPDRLLKFFSDKILEEAKKFKSFIKGKICLETNTEDRHDLALRYIWKNGVSEFVIDKYGEVEADYIYDELVQQVVNEDFEGYHERFVGGFYDSFVSGTYYDIYYEISKLRKDSNMLKKEIKLIAKDIKLA